jgi:hypothetical protein
MNSLKKPLVLAVFFALPGTAQACSDCAAATAYGQLVLSNVGSATSEVSSATVAIQRGFQMLIQSIQALSSNVTTEINKSARSQKVLLDESNRQEEQRMKAKYTLESKNFYEERYGLDNIPLEACQDYINAIDMADTKGGSEEELRVAIDSFMNEYREAAPSSDWKYHQRTLEHASVQGLSFDKAVYSSDDVQNAIEYINQTIDPVPVTIINPEREIASLNADERIVWSGIQTLNLRLDSAKSSLKEQVLLKSPIVGSDQSIQGLLEANAFEGLDDDNIIDIAMSSETKLLKNLLRDAQYASFIEYETLKSSLRASKIKGVNLASNLDETRQILKTLGNRMRLTNEEN